MKYTKNLRLLKKSHYARVAQARKRIIGVFLRVDYNFGLGMVPKLGLTVPSSFGKANKRNSFKRKARESFRLSYHLFPKNLEINLFPNKEALNAKTLDIQKELVTLCSRLK